MIIGNMNILTPSIKNYLDNMKPGTTINIWQQRYPLILIYAAKEYIDQGGQLTISSDYETITKL